MSSTQEVGDIFGQGPHDPAHAMLRSPTVLIASVGLWGMNILLFRYFKLNYKYILTYDLVQEHQQQQQKQQQQNQQHKSSSSSSQQQQGRGEKNDDAMTITKTTTQALHRQEGQGGRNMNEDDLEENPKQQQIEMVKTTTTTTTTSFAGIGSAEEGFSLLSSATTGGGPGHGGTAIDTSRRTVPLGTPATGIDDYDEYDDGKKHDDHTPLLKMSASATKPAATTAATAAASGPTSSIVSPFLTFQDDAELERTGGSITWYKLFFFSISMVVWLHFITMFWMDYLHRDSFIGPVLCFYSSVLIYMCVPITSTNRWLRRALTVVLWRSWELIRPRFHYLYNYYKTNKYYYKKCNRKGHNGDDGDDDNNGDDDDDYHHYHPDLKKRSSDIYLQKGAAGATTASNVVGAGGGGSTTGATMSGIDTTITSKTTSTTGNLTTTLTSTTTNSSSLSAAAAAAASKDALSTSSVNSLSSSSAPLDKSATAAAIDAINAATTDTTSRSAAPNLHGPGGNSKLAKARQVRPSVSTIVSSMIFRFCQCCHRWITPPRAIPFLDVFFADAMCSLSKVFFDWGMLLHLLIHYPNPVPSVPSNILFPSFCAAIPYLIRARQCLIMHTVGKLKNDPKRYQHLANALKYSTSIFPLMFSAYMKTLDDPDREKELDWILIILITINACYALYWDIVMDWGMMQDGVATAVVQTACMPVGAVTGSMPQQFQPFNTITMPTTATTQPSSVTMTSSTSSNANATAAGANTNNNSSTITTIATSSTTTKPITTTTTTTLSTATSSSTPKECHHVLLRPKLRFGLWLSAAIVLIDAILRFSWMLRFVNDTIFPNNDSFVLCTQFLEVFRRAIWNLLRVEWENIKIKKKLAAQQEEEELLYEQEERERRRRRRRRKDASTTTTKVDVDDDHHHHHDDDDDDVDDPNIIWGNTSKSSSDLHHVNHHHHQHHHGAPDALMVMLRGGSSGGSGGGGGGGGGPPSSPGGITTSSAGSLISVDAKKQ